MKFTEERCQCKKAKYQTSISESYHGPSLFSKFSSLLLFNRPLAGDIFAESQTVFDKSKACCGRLKNHLAACGRQPLLIKNVFTYRSKIFGQQPIKM
jgi:hypothetical protein